MVAMSTPPDSAAFTASDRILPELVVDAVGEHLQWPITLAGESR